jgi:uncharacterized protein DUF5309
VITRKIITKGIIDWATLTVEHVETIDYSGPMALAAAPADYLDTSDLKSVTAGGLIREDVLDQIFDCSDIGTPFLDMIGTDGFENSYSEWTEDALVAPNTANAVVSGADAASANNNANVTNAKRVGNQAQISEKLVMVTERGQATTSVGRSDEMGYQTARRLQELRRDIEAIYLSPQASVADDNNATAGKTGGMDAWLKTNVTTGATGAVGGFNTGTKLVVAPTNGTKAALTWAQITTQIQNVYTLGGNPTVLMSVPGMTKRIANYLIGTSLSAKPTQNVQGTGDGVSQTAQMFVDAFKTDFGFMMQIIPNRLQQTYGATACTVFGIDPRFWKLGLLYGWKVDPLAKLGLSYRKMLHADWMVKAYLERANFSIRDADPTAAVT